MTGLALTDLRLSRRRSILLAAPFALALCSAVASAASEAPDPQLPSDPAVRRPPFCGVWGIWGGEKVSNEGRPWFKGVVTTTNWDSVEPANGKFVWDEFDRKVHQVVDKGLCAVLMVYHGHQAPAWIYDAGVPKVMTRADKESRAAHPYYLDPAYKPLLSRMIRETAKHIASYPPELRARIVGVQCPTGKSGDPQAYEAEPVEAKYQISLHSREWVEWTLGMIQVYRDAYKDFRPPFFMLFKGPNPDTNDWLVKNIPDSWRKPHAIAQGYQFNGELDIMNELYPLTRRYQGNLVIRTRGELDNTEGGRQNWFNSAPVWNVYWSGLWNLTYGTDLWSQLNGVLEDERHVPALAFYSKYAGYKDAADSPGAWIALRDGLDCMDTKRFPEDRFGAVGEHGAGRPSANKERYRKIAESLAAFGAANEDLENADANGLNVRRQKGINDVGGYIWTDNYGMFLEQLDANATSQGYWRVGSKDERFGRFGRGFDAKNGKKAMSFRLDDRFFAPPAGAQPPAAQRSPSEPQSVTVRVVYFDKGQGAWALSCAGGKDGGKSEALRVTCADSGKWREATATIDGAYFDHRLKIGQTAADLALEWLSGDDTIFHMIELTRKER